MSLYLLYPHYILYKVRRPNNWVMC